jgi:hypothetical protein
VNGFVGLRPLVILTMVLLLVLPAVVLAGGSAGAVTTCAAAFASLETGDLTAFATVKPADSACAREGVAAEADLAEAQQLIAIDLDAAADSRIVEALQAEPLLSVRDVLSRTQTGPQSIMLAEALDRDGFHAQAAAVLLQAITIDPGLRLDQDAKGILGLIRPPWYLRLWHFVASSDVLTGLLILVLLVAVAAVPRLRRRLYLQPFTAADGLDSGAGQAATLRLLIREELSRMARQSAQLPGGRRLRLHIAGPYDDRDQIDLGQLADDLPAPLKVTYQVICLVLRWTGSRSSLVIGALQHGDAMELDLKTIDGRHQRGEVFKHADLGFPPPGGTAAGSDPHAPDLVARRLEQLAVPAAAWIILARYRRATLGGTRSLASYLAFAGGCAWEAEATPQTAGTSPTAVVPGDQRQARECYQRACRDAENTAAAINLAMLEKLEDPGTGPLEDRPWYQMLLRVASQTGGRRFLFFKRGRRDLQWYRANYLLSSAQREFLESRSSVDGLDRAVQRDIDAAARRRAVEVAIELEKRARRRGGLPKEFVEYGRAAALTLLARQMTTRTADLGQVLSRRRSPAIRKGGIRRELAAIKRHPVDSVSSAKLVEFTTAHRPIDDQAGYNLALYRRARYRNCVAAIDEYQEAVDRSSRDLRPTTDAWRADVGQYMDQLEEECQLELAEMHRWEERVLEANDPVLAVEVERLEHINLRPPSQERSHDSVYRETGEPRRGPTPAPPLRPPGEPPVRPPVRPPDRPRATRRTRDRDDRRPPGDDRRPPGGDPLSGPMI